MNIRVLVAVATLALAGAITAKLRAAPSKPPQLPDLHALPTELDGWWSEEVPLKNVEREVLAADTTAYRLYHKQDGSKVWVFVAYFAEQRVNGQIHSPKQCLPGAGWHVRSAGTRLVTTAGVACPTSCLEIADEMHSERVYYWFRTRSGRVVGEYALKVDLVKNALRGRPTDAAYVRVISAEPAAAEELMTLLDAPLRHVLAEIGL